MNDINMENTKLSSTRLKMRAESVIYKLCNERVEHIYEQMLCGEPIEFVCNQILDEAFPVGYEDAAYKIIEYVLKEKFSNRPTIEKRMTVMMECVKRWRDARKESGCQMHDEQTKQEPEAKNNAGTAFQLPPTLEKGRVAFEKAIAKGWIKIRPDGRFEWIGFGRTGIKAELGYFCGKIWGYKYDANKGNIGGKVPYLDLEIIFGERRLESALNQVHNAKKPQLWRQEINSIFDND